MRPFRKQGAPSRRRRIRKTRLLALLTVLGLLASVSFGFGLITAVAGEIPKLDPRRQIEQEVNGAIYADNGRSVLAVLRGAEARTLVDLEDIDPLMRHAIVAIEDRRFWEHKGVDLRGIVRALWADIRQQKVVEGGSTITQQFVKNALLQDQQTIGRKVREAALAWQLHQQWKPRRILEAYLNTIYFGNGAYGVQQAARIYFGHGSKDMTLAEAALLAGIPANPTAFDPIQHPQAARERRRIVLQAMLEEGKITPTELAVADSSALPTEVALPATQRTAHYFVNYVKQQLIDQYGATMVYGGGLRVTTTIDLELQQLAHDAIAKWLTEPDDPAAALVAIDPRTGAVKAMVGGENYRESQFNLAVQGERQPGSAFKPFVLATALKQGISPLTTMASRPQQIDLGDKLWVVSNYDDAYLGTADLETATIHSDNAVYAQLTQLVGAKKVAATARSLGIQSPLNGFYSIGLGTEAVNPLEMARAYATFANRGRRVDTSFPRSPNQPRAIVEITDHEGDPILVNRPRPRQVLPRDKAAIVNSILQKVVSQGTGARARLDDRPAAGKTGTTENYGDAWFVGYTPELAVAVWVGYPTTLKPMLTEFNGEPVSGSTFPAAIWKTFMERALEHEGVEPSTFEAPPLLYATPKVVARRGDGLLLDNGQCEDTISVVYFSEMGPQRQASCRPDEVEVPDVRGRSLADAERRLSMQPLTAEIVYKPAEPLQPAGVVVEQRPRGGYASAFDRVILVVTKPLDGVIPNLVGKKVDVARERLEKLGIEPEITWVEGDEEKVLEQTPKAGLAAAPGVTVRLVASRPSD